MGALTENFPKALLPVGGRPILDYLVAQLTETGRFDELVVMTNHRDHDHFVEWIATRPHDAGASPIRLIDDGTTSNQNRLGAIGDLALAIEVAELHGPLLVAAGDNLFRFDMGAYFADFDLDGGSNSMILLSHETDPAKLSRSGVAEVDATGRLLRLWEKPEDPPSEYCCPPLYLLTQEALEEIAACREAQPEADAPGHLVAWLAERVVVRTHLMRGSRLDVGDAASYAAAEAWLLLN